MGQFKNEEIKREEKATLGDKKYYLLNRSESLRDLSSELNNVLKVHSDDVGMIKILLQDIRDISATCLGFINE